MLAAPISPSLNYISGVIIGWKHIDKIKLVEKVVKSRLLVPNIFLM